VNSIYLFSLITLLAGCTSNPLAEQQQATQQMEYKIKVYGPACETLGFEMNTDAWRACVQKEYEQTLIQRQYQRNNSYFNPYYSQPRFYLR
jgi:hypothetical protein